MNHYMKTPLQASDLWQVACIAHRAQVSRSVECLLSSRTKLPEVYFLLIVRIERV